MRSLSERLVQYYAEGWRAGWLLEDTEWDRTAQVQIKTIEPTSRVIWVAREDVREVTQ